MDRLCRFHMGTAPVIEVRLVARDAFLCSGFPMWTWLIFSSRLSFAEISRRDFGDSATSGMARRSFVASSVSPGMEATGGARVVLCRFFKMLDGETI